MSGLGDLTNDEIIATLADGMLCQPDRCRHRVPNSCTCALIAERLKAQGSKLSSAEKDREQTAKLVSTLERRLAKAEWEGDFLADLEHAILAGNRKPGDPEPVGLLSGVVERQEKNS